MPGDPLKTMLRLRQRAVDEARANLSEAMDSEARAEADANEVERAIETEAQRAADPADGDELVDAFAAWLPAARQRARATRTEQERLAAAVACRRAELTASRTGLEVIETLLRKKADAAMRDEIQRQQRAIDEAGASRHRRLRS